jgi:hypothetical protein
MSAYQVLIGQLKEIQDQFASEFNVNDIFSNSKIFEILIADSLGHELIPGHSGSRDAILDSQEFEYKHYKELSSNHSWTFNDYSSTTISRLNSESVTVIFAHVNDQLFPPVFDWYYEVSGSDMSRYLTIHTSSIQNGRKMINVSKSQLEDRIGASKINVSHRSNGMYQQDLEKLFQTVRQLEKLTKVEGLLTSNKIWELVVAARLSHQVNSEQGGRAGAHDARDSDGNWFEYKVGISTSWSFQDISESVLEKFLETKAIICATVDKQRFEVSAVYAIAPELLVPELRNMLALRTQASGTLRRQQVSISKKKLLDFGGERLL